jgi:hypothetical protein
LSSDERAVVIAGRGVEVDDLVEALGLVFGGVEEEG